MCLVGVYSVNSSYVDLYVLVLFGIVGFILQDLGYSPAPLVLAFVIGPRMETALRESLMINQGAIAPMIFRPIAGTIYPAAALVLILPPVLRAFRRRRSIASVPSGGVVRSALPGLRPEEFTTRRPFPSHGNRTVSFVTFMLL